MFVLLLAWFVYVSGFKMELHMEGHVPSAINFLGCCFVVDTKLGVKKERCKFGD